MEVEVKGAQTSRRVTLLSDSSISQFDGLSRGVIDLTRAARFARTPRSYTSRQISFSSLTSKAGRNIFKSLSCQWRRVRTEGVTGFGLVLGRLQRRNQDAIENLNNSECSCRVHRTWVVVCLGTDDICDTYFRHIRKYRYRARGTHHNDAASWTSVTRLLIKDKTEARGDAATYTE
jgi:hypothetical protein